MLQRMMFFAVAVVLATTPMAALAQQDDDAPPMYIYATYLECDTDRQWIADMVVSDLYGPAWDAAVDDGTISSWGWLAHHTGGKWRRLRYHTASDMKTLLGALTEINQPIDAANPGPARGLSEACNAHVDYIWQYGTGSGGSAAVRERADAALSVYMECDMDRESRADEIVEEVFAPIYDRYVADGTIASWGWLEHYVGGQWRRLSTMTGDSHEAVLAARGAMIEEMYEKHADVAAEFDSICDSHQDYLWNVIHEKP